MDWFERPVNAKFVSDYIFRYTCHIFMFPCKGSFPPFEEGYEVFFHFAKDP
ncbi:hypothetical protein Hanom_Chr12g01083031 [Helianthus anomalus]